MILMREAKLKAAVVQEEELRGHLEEMKAGRTGRHRWIDGISWEYHGNIMGIFDGNIMGISWEFLMGISWEYHGNF